MVQWLYKKLDRTEPAASRAVCNGGGEAGFSLALALARDKLSLLL